MENKVLKVRIKKSSGERYWYADQIGEVFEVVDIGHKSDYTVSEDYLLGENAGWRHIQKDDCEIIPASLSQPSKDVESAAKEWANSGSYKAWLNDGMDRSHYGSTIRSFKAGAEWAASHQPQCQIGAKRFTPITEELPDYYKVVEAVSPNYEKGLKVWRGSDGENDLWTIADTNIIVDAPTHWVSNILSESSPAEEKVQILVEALRKIEQMSDPGSYEKAIIDMKSTASKALNKFKNPQQ